MGITERRQREKEGLRSRILDAARELFAAHGYEAVTMRRIAEAIEYSPTALYVHFKDKDALIRELCLADFDDLAVGLRRIAKEPDPLERLRRIGMAYVEFAIERPNHYRLMFMTPHPEGSHPTEEDKAVRAGNPEADAYALLVATIEEAIAKGLLRPEMKDAHLVAQATWAGVHGVVSLHIAKKQDPWLEWRSERKTAALVIESMTRGIARKARS